MNKNRYRECRTLTISVLFLLVGSFQSLRSQTPVGNVGSPLSSSRANTRYDKPAKRQAQSKAIYEGDKAREANNYHKAFASYQKVAEKVPDDPRALYGMGAVYFDLTCNDKAVQSFTDALRIDKNFKNARIALGYAYVAQGRYELAKKEFQRVDDIPAKIGLAYTIGKDKKYDEAIRQLNLIIDTSRISKKDRAMAYLHLGNVYFDQKKWDEATTSFNNAIKEDPDLSVAYVRLGQVKLFQTSARLSLLAVQEMTIADRERLITAGKEAADYFGRPSIEHRYKHPIADLFLAHALLNQFNYKDAVDRVEEYFRKLNTLKDQSPALSANCDAGFKELSTSGYFYLALIYNQQALFEKNGSQKEVYLARVRENADKIVAVRENNPLALSLLAGVYFQQGKWSDAILHFDKAISHETNKENQGQSYELMGISYEQLGNDKEAMHAYNSALRLRPSSASARLSLSRMYEKNGDFDKAISLKEEAIERTPEESATLLWQLALSYFSRARARNLDADYEKAITLLDKALHANQSFWYAYLALGNVYKFYKNGAHADDALKNYRIAETYAREDPSVKFLIGDLFYSVKKNPAAAISYLEQAIKLKTDYVDARWILGLAFRDAGDYSKAIEELNAALNLNHKHLRAYINLAELYGWQKNYDGAIEVLLKAVKELPTEFMPRKELARMYSYQGRNKEAIESYEAAISLTTAEQAFLRDVFRCRILRLQGRRADALACVQSIKLPNASDTDQIYYEIGLIHVADKNREAALAQYEKLKQMNSPLAPDLRREIDELR